MRYPDYEEFIGALNDQGARYLIVGAHAVAYHARPRATRDFDIFIERTPANAKKVLAALTAFLGADLGYTVDDLLDPDSFIQLGVAPVRIDLMSEVKGCRSFSSVWKNRIEANFGDLPAYYLGLEDLIQAKLACGRKQDHYDVRALRRARDAQRPRRSRRRSQRHQ
jgi:predicted nucleotidyltransferase